MKTTKLSICITMTITSFLCSAHAQEQQSMTTVDSLMMYEWVSTIDLSGSDVKELYTVFDETHKKNVTIYDPTHEDYEPDWGPIFESSVPYYVSDTADSLFMEEKVGISRNGRYIITQGLNGLTNKYETSGREILLLNDEYFVLRNWTEWPEQFLSTIDVMRSRPKKDRIEEE